MYKFSKFNIFESTMHSLSDSSICCGIKQNSVLKGQRRLWKKMFPCQSKQEGLAVRTHSHIAELFQICWSNLIIINCRAFHECSLLLSFCPHSELFLPRPIHVLSHLREEIWNKCLLGANLWLGTEDIKVKKKKVPIFMVLEFIRINQA